MKKGILFLLVVLLLHSNALCENAYETLQDYIDDSANLSEFDPELISELSDFDYDVIDGVLFRDGVLLRYPAGKKQKEYAIPEGISALDRNAFLFVDPDTINTLIIPESCTALGDGDGGVWVPYLGGLKDIVVAENNPMYASKDGLLLSKDQKTLLYYPANRSEEIFVIPESVESIGSFSCWGAKFSQVVFPSGLRYIGCQAFGENQLLSLEFPSTLIGIDDFAFELSANLTSVEIPSSVKTIGAYAFSQCEQLTSVILHEGLECVESYAFFATPIRTLNLPGSLYDIGELIVSYSDDAGNIVSAQYGVKEHSYAHQWAQANDEPYVIMGDDSY